MKLDLNKFTGSVEVTNKGTVLIQNEDYKVAITKKGIVEKLLDKAKDIKKSEVKKKEIDHRVPNRIAASKPITLESEIYIYKFSSIKQASDILNLSYAHLTTAIREGYEQFEDYKIVK